MQEEIEIKFLNVNVEALENKILSLGGKKIFDRKFKRIVFDYLDYRLDKDSSWLRLRDEGDYVKLAFKRVIKNGNDASLKDVGMIESEVVVEDFDKMRKILLHIGMIEKMYQENKRVRFILNDVEIDIDIWPLINPYVGIEGKSYDEVYKISEMLGFKKEDAKICSANEIYKTNNLDDRNFSKLTFEEQILKTDKIF